MLSQKGYHESESKLRWCQSSLFYAVFENQSVK